MDTAIICSIIETVGAVLVAVIGAGSAVCVALLAKNVVKKDIKPLFQSYSDKTHDIKGFLSKARHNVVIITALGNKLLPRVRADLDEKLNCGIRIYYLFLTPPRYLEMEQYMHGDDAKDISGYNEFVDELRKLSYAFGNRFQVRTFPYQMSASYIGIDLPFDSEEIPSSSDPAIQVMQYQYMVRARNSPLFYFYPDKNRERFDSTVESMKKMWQAGEELPPDSTNTEG